RGQMYDAAASILARQLSQVEGVGGVHVWGSSRPAVRAEINPTVLNAMGLTLTDVAGVLQNANAHQAKGALNDATIRWQVNAIDQLFTAKEYAPLIVAYRNG